MKGNPPARGGGRAGAALVTTILFALVLLVAGHGILVFTRTQEWVTAQDGARWAADEGRQAALREVLAGSDTLPGAGLVGTPWGTVTVRRLGPELRFLSAEPEPGSGGTGWATLIASPMPVARVRARSGAARVGGAVFETGALVAVPSDEACPTGLEAVALSRVGPLPDSPPMPRLGVLDFDELLEAFPRLTSDRLELPGTGPSACEEPGGFGDPHRPGSCSEAWGAGSRVGDLTVGGRGQGVLAVSGSLTLESDAHFRGWIWVGGALRVEAGAEFRGLADVGGRFIVDPGGLFSPDGCAGGLALESARHALRPRQVGPRAWPLFRP